MRLLLLLLTLTLTSSIDARVHSSSLRRMIAAVAIRECDPAIEVCTTVAPTLEPPTPNPALVAECAVDPDCPKECVFSGPNITCSAFGVVLPYTAIRPCDPEIETCPTQDPNATSAPYNPIIAAECLADPECPKECIFTGPNPTCLIGGINIPIVLTYGTISPPTSTPTSTPIPQVVADCLADPDCPFKVCDDDVGVCVIDGVSYPIPTTVAPTTEAPTATEAPTTVAPTTEAPTTVAPTTVTPATPAPTTEAPTTVAPTTEAPTTVTPTTPAPTTETPTTVAPTTEAPEVTPAPELPTPACYTIPSPSSYPRCALYWACMNTGSGFDWCRCNDGEGHQFGLSSDCITSPSNDARCGTFQWSAPVRTLICEPTKETTDAPTQMPTTQVPTTEAPATTEAPTPAPTPSCYEIPSPSSYARCAIYWGCMNSGSGFDWCRCNDGDGGVMGFYPDCITSTVNDVRCGTFTFTAPIRTEICLPTTQAPTPAAPTTQVTEAPTTEAPTTTAPTDAVTPAPTPAPTAAATTSPTSVVTESPAVTPAPTTASTAATDAPTAAATDVPTSAATVAPTAAATEAPTSAPTTATPTTAVPATAAPSTAAPTTVAPTTTVPTVTTAPTSTVSASSTALSLSSSSSSTADSSTADAIGVTSTGNEAINVQKNSAHVISSIGSFTVAVLVTIIATLTF